MFDLFICFTHYPSARSRRYLPTSSNSWYLILDKGIAWHMRYINVRWNSTTNCTWQNCLRADQPLMIDPSVFTYFKETLHYNYPFWFKMNWTITFQIFLKPRTLIMHECYFLNQLTDGNQIIMNEFQSAISQNNYKI